MHFFRPDREQSVPTEEIKGSDKGSTGEGSDPETVGGKRYRAALE